ncbi:hypothetical protein FACS1894110_25030 [Spirochaetia bacterium]|nr:hypothetical protein FACS1894110_25030 [Spirochaetia bacterium]
MPLGVLAIMPNKSFNSDFVFFALDLMTESIRRNAGETAGPIINKTEFGNIEIPLPPTLVEQNIIAEVLSDIDSLIRCEGYIPCLRRGMLMNIFFSYIKL